MAYADLDNDGDLDLVVNNLDDKSVVYENRTSNNQSNNYLRIKLLGPDNNPFGIGCKVWLEDNEGQQYQEMTMTRGFQSSVEPVVHFGVGQKEVIGTVRIIWPDGRSESINNVKTDQVISMAYKNAIPTMNNLAVSKKNYFEDVTKKFGLHYKHEENN